MKKKMVFIIASLWMGICVGEAQVFHLQTTKKAESIEKKLLENPVNGNKLNKLKVKEVLSSKQLKDGSLYKLVRLENGLVKKQLVNPDKQLQNKIMPLSAFRSSTSIETVAAADALFEGFEGWDDITPDWLPTGWTDESKVNSPSNVVDAWGDPVNYTWTTAAGSYYVQPKQGKNCARVQFATPYYITGTADEDGDGALDPIEVQPPIPQDEWLLSPVVNVKQQDYVFAFDLYYDPFWCRARFNENTEEWIFDQMHTLIEAYISIDNGTSWVKKWDNQENASGYTGDELLKFVYGIEFIPWLKISIDLAAYHNQDIRVAIRYYDDGGESAYVDNVTVGYIAPEVSYRRPEGYLMSGLSKDYGSLNNNIINGNAFVPTQWWGDVAYANTVSWDFDQLGVQQGNNPVVTLPYGLYSTPTLTATGKGGSTAFQLKEETTPYLMTSGGDNYWYIPGYADPFLFGSGNYDLAYKFTYFSDINAEDMASLASELNLGAFYGISNVFEKPAGKLLFNTFNVHLGNIVTKTGEPVRLKIYAVDENTGAVGKLLAQSETYPADFVMVAGNDGFKYYTIPFECRGIQEDGRLADYVEIETAFLVEFSNYKTADVFVQAGDHPTKVNYAYISFQKGYFPLSNFAYRTSWLFDMDVIYPFLYTEDNKYAAPNNGGTKNLEVRSYWLPSVWETDAEIPEWITIEEMTANPSTGAITVPVTVDPLPSGVTGRNANITIFTPGCELTLQFKQGDAYYTSVAAITTASSSARASLQGDVFRLTYPAGTTSVAVYTVDGRKVASYYLPLNGESTIPATGLSKGIYILRFSGKTTEAVKVIR
jgi:hypothetical protein